MKEYYVAVLGDQEEYGDFDSRDGWRLERLAEQLVRRLKLTTSRKCPQQVSVTVFRLRTKDGKLDRHKIQTFNIMPYIESITNDEFNQELAEALEGIPDEFKTFVNQSSYDRGHSAGMEEVLNIANELVSELSPCIEAFRQSIIKKYSNKV